MSVAISPRNDSDRERFQRALRILAEEDPAIQIKTKSLNGQTTLCGMTDLHLEMRCDRISREFKIPLDVGEPRVIYLETIRKSAEGEGKYIRQAGGFGNYGHCKLRVEPNGPDRGYKFINEIKDGPIITAAVPLAEMIGYGRELRSNTQGRAFHSMKFARYEAASRPEESGDDYPYVAANKPTGSKPGSGASLDAELK